MNEKPILFSSETVRAILDGKKTQTRRVIKHQPEFGAYRPLNAFERVCVVHEDVFGNGIATQTCPYLETIGDTLWVRESYISLGAGAIFYKADGHDAGGYRWIPSIHMPRNASRINLNITDLRVERLQEISEQDAQAEGAIAWHDTNQGTVYKPEFKMLWDKLNSKRVPKHLKFWDKLDSTRGFGWDTNPWVWVIEFQIAD